MATDGFKVVCWLPKKDKWTVPRGCKAKPCDSTHFEFRVLSSPYLRDYLPVRKLISPFQVAEVIVDKWDEIEDRRDEVNHEYPERSNILYYSLEDLNHWSAKQIRNERLRKARDAARETGVWCDPWKKEAEDPRPKAILKPNAKANRRRKWSLQPNAKLNRQRKLSLKPNAKPNRQRKWILKSIYQ